MEKHIPYEKLSKKEKRKLDLARRNTWNSLNPVTRKPLNSKAYNRKRTQDWKKELMIPLWAAASRAAYRPGYPAGRNFLHVSALSALFRPNWSERT